jgi:hypothetical protein
MEQQIPQLVQAKNSGSKMNLSINNLIRENQGDQARDFLPRNTPNTRKNFDAYCHGDDYIPNTLSRRSFSGVSLSQLACFESISFRLPSSALKRLKQVRGIKRTFCGKKEKTPRKENTLTSNSNYNDYDGYHDGFQGGFKSIFLHHIYTEHYRY